MPNNSSADSEQQRRQQWWSGGEQQLRIAMVFKIRGVVDDYDVSVLEPAVSWDQKCEEQRRGRIRADNQ
ncbi:hypothetical protein Tco_0335501, partial [Tanacetum coccineum]